MINISNNISKILVNKKDYYISLIRGLLEIELVNYLTNIGFHYFSLSSLKEYTGSKTHVISFDYDEQKFELNSSQALQITALSAIYSKVFSINEAFRKETVSDTNHLSEFKILELEFPIDGENDIFNFIETLLTHMINWFNNYLKDNGLLELFKKKEIKLPFERVSFEDLPKRLGQDNSKLNFNHFTFCDDEVTKLINEPLIIKYYPSVCGWRSLKKDQNHSYLYNLVMPNGLGELIEFSIRETRYEFYRRKFEHLNYLGIYNWYLDAIKQNQSPRAGLGMGIERLGSWLMDLDKIEEQLVFPCVPERG